MADKDKYKRLQAEVVFLMNDWERVALRSEPGENGKWYAKPKGQVEREILHDTNVVKDAILEWNEISEKEYHEH